MEYIYATRDNIDEVYELVKYTINYIYPKYYPKGVVDFFRKHHSRDNILKDIDAGTVGMLVDGGRLVGTGTYNDNHITRVYVHPRFQGKGYGIYIIRVLERTIAKQYNEVYLDASLPACKLYERCGYVTQSHEKCMCENGTVLVYEVMVKNLDVVKNTISYDGKRFIPKCNASNGEVNNETTFVYQQNGSKLWGTYSGGGVTNGVINGQVLDNGELEFCYQHINKNSELRIGTCHSIPHILDNDKLELEEYWQWLNGDMSKGTSTITEI